MSNVRRSFVYSILSKYLSRFINLATVIFIARSLSPDELGVFAIASSIVLIASELKSFGADGYLIREKSIDADTVSKALGISSAISWGVGTIVFFLSWFIESYYQFDDLASLIQILVISFFLSPHIGIGRSLFARRFQFDKLLVVDTSSQVIQFASVVGFVSAGFGYYSLVYATVLGYILELALVVYFKPEYFVFRPKFIQDRKIAKFGLYVTFANLFRKLSMTLPELIIGKLGTASQVAYFSRGTGFINFVSMTINSGIRPVIAPYLADKQRNGVALSQPYLHATKMVGGIMMPVLAVAGYASETVIVGMFGEQWVQSAPLVTALCIAAIFRSSISISIQMFVTAGYEKALCILDFGLFVLTAVLVYILFPYGLVNTAYAFVIVGFIRFVSSIIMLRTLFSISLTSQCLNYIVNVLISISCVGVIYVFEAVFALEQLYAEFFAVACLASLSWIAAIFVFRHPLSDEVLRVVNASRQKMKLRKGI